MHILPYILTTKKISQNCLEDNSNIEKVILAQFHSKQAASKTVNMNFILYDCTLISVVYVCIGPSVPDVNETSL